MDNSAWYSWLCGPYSCEIVSRLSKCTKKYALPLVFSMFFLKLTIRSEGFSEGIIVLPSKISLEQALPAFVMFMCVKQSMPVFFSVLAIVFPLNRFPGSTSNVLFFSLEWARSNFNALITPAFFM